MVSVLVAAPSKSEIDDHGLGWAVDIILQFGKTRLVSCLEKIPDNVATQLGQWPPPTGGATAQNLVWFACWHAVCQYGPLKLVRLDPRLGTG